MSDFLTSALAYICGSNEGPLSNLGAQRGKTVNPQCRVDPPLTVAPSAKQQSCFASIYTELPPLSTLHCGLEVRSGLGFRTLGFRRDLREVT